MNETKKVKDYWNKQHDNLCDTAEQEDPCIVKFLGNVNGKEILDLGCGNGFLSISLAKKGAKVTSIDISENAVKNLNHLVKINNLENFVNVEKLDAFELYKLNKQFDLIVGNFVLHHLEPFDKFCEILYTNLKMGGRCIFLENNSRNLILLFFRKFVVGRFGIPKFGDSEEHPLELKELNLLKKRFGKIKIHYLEFFFFSLLTIYLFRCNIKKFGQLFRLFGILDCFVYRFFPIFNRYSYLQIVELKRIKMKTNILYLNINSNLGGAERTMLEEVSGLKNEKFNPVVGLFLNGPLVDELKKEKISYTIFPSSKKLLGQSQEKIGLKLILESPALLFEIYKIVKKIALFIKEKDIDIVVSNSFKTHLMSYLLKKFTKAKIIWRYHDSLPKEGILKKAILKLARSIPDKIVANSNFVRNQFIKNKFDEKKVSVVYPIYIKKSIVCSKEEKNKFRDEFKISKKDFAVGCLGILVPWKGQEYLIRAAKLLKNRIPNFKVFIVGDTIYDTKAAGSKNYLISLTKELGLESTVVFTGFVKEPMRILNALDVVVHTSIRPEPFGRVIAEGMACGKPVIASALGGPLEIIDNNKNGMLIKPKDPGLLADAIFELYKNPDKMKMIGKNGREFAVKSFDLNTQIKRLEKIYLYT